MRETPSLVDSSSVPTSAPTIVAAPNTDCSTTTEADLDTITSGSEPVVHEDDGDDEWQDDQDDPDDLQDEPNKNTLVSPPKVSRPVNPIPELDDDDDEDEDHNLLPYDNTLRVWMGPEQRARAKIKAKTVKKRTAALHDNIATLHAERETQAAELAKKHGFKPVLVCQRLSAASSFKKRRAISLFAAKVHYLGKVLNKGESCAVFLQRAGTRGPMLYPIA
ncbi:hypothetical protein DFH09DRAFT_1348618 [Mycena vulgaris]|nr:hypothetical protein DFH09DRAFT_1348618 [Mycena vulgaris]